MAPPTAAELDVIAMCVGKKSMFTEKEQKLLDLADKSDQATLRESADAIRSRRKEQLQNACDKLKADGKY